MTKEERKDQWSERFARKLGEAMKARKIGQAELGRAMGLSQSQIWRWLKAENVPRPADFPRLSRALDVPVVYLIDEAVEAPEQASPSRVPPDIASMIEIVGEDEARRRLLQAPAAVPSGNHRVEDDREAPGAYRKAR